MKVGLSIAVFGVGIGSCIGIAAAMPGDGVLAPHRAVYAMNLASTRLGTGVTGVTGQMTYKFGDSCDGWTTESRTDLTFSNSNEDAPVATSWDFVTWESKDGLRYRFRMRNTRDGVVDEISGTATLDGPGEGGIAKFTLPEEKTIRLSKGTIFPTEHTLRLIENARDGERQVEKVLFDGTEVEDSFDVNAMIGTMIPADSETATPEPSSVPPAIDRHLLAEPAWNMDLAFFPKDSYDAEPDYEVDMRYYQNGVADQMLQSFGNFTIRGTLQKLEALPKPDC